MRGIGFNIDGMFLHNDIKKTLKEKLIRSNPAVITVLSDIAYALELKNALPKTQVIFRQFWGSEYDNIQRTTSPDEYIAIYRDAIRLGLIAYTANEPHPDELLANWEYEVASKVLQLGGKSVHFNWSVGMPAVDDDKLRIFSKNLALIGKNRGKLFWGIHEYWFGHPFIEFNVSPRASTWESVVIPPEQKPWVIGRHRWTTNFCDRNNIPRPMMIITEFGWDDIYTLYHHIPEIPGYKYPYRLPNIIPALETWGMADGISWQEYAEKQFITVWEKIYRRSKDIIGACMFPYGGSGVWGEASIHYYEDLVNRLSFGYNYSTDAVINPPPAATGVISGMNLGKMKAIKWTGINMNFRLTPSLSAKVPLMVLTGGLAGFLFEDKIEVADGYTWRLALFPNIKGEMCLGWFAATHPGSKWVFV